MCKLQNVKCINSQKSKRIIAYKKNVNTFEFSENLQQIRHNCRFQQN